MVRMNEIKTGEFKDDYVTVQVYDLKFRGQLSIPAQNLTSEEKNNLKENGIIFRTTDVNDTLFVRVR